MLYSNIEAVHRLKSELDQAKRFLAKIKAELVVSIAIGRHTSVHLNDAVTWGPPGVSTYTMPEDLRGRLHGSMCAWCDEKIEAIERDLVALGIDLGKAP